MSARSAPLVPPDALVVVDALLEEPVPVGDVAVDAAEEAVVVAVPLNRMALF